MAEVITEKGDESLQERQLSARGQPMRDGQQSARGGPLQDGQHSARGGPSQDGQQSARSQAMREGQQSARGPLQDGQPSKHDDQEPSAPGASTREGQQSARGNPQEGQRSARGGALQEEQSRDGSEMGSRRTSSLGDASEASRSNDELVTERKPLPTGPADQDMRVDDGKDFTGDDFPSAEPPKSARSVRMSDGHSGGAADMANSLPPLEPPKSSRSQRSAGARSGAETGRKSGAATQIEMNEDEEEDENEDGENEDPNANSAGLPRAAGASEAISQASSARSGRRQWGPPVGKLHLGDKMQTDQQENSSRGRRVSWSRASDTSSEMSFRTRNIVENFRVNLKSMRNWGEDDTSMRLAFEQLDNLAENTKTVHSALESNRVMFEQQLLAARRRRVCIAFRAWWNETQRAQKRRHAAKQRFVMVLKLKTAKIMHAWKDLTASQRKVWRLEPSALKLMGQHCLCRVWGTWRRMTMQTQFKLELERREEQLALVLEERWRVGVFRRGNNVLYRRRLSRAFKAFKEGVEIKKAKASFSRYAIRLLQKGKNHRILQAWKQIAEFKAMKSRWGDAVAVKLRKKKMQRIFLALRHVTAQQRLTKHCIQWFRRRRMQRAMRPAFAAMAAAAGVRKEKNTKLKYVQSRLDRGRMARAFRAMAQVCSRQAMRKKVAARAIKRMQRWRLALAFRAWVLVMQMGADGKVCKLGEQFEQLQNENKSLKADVARLARIIDARDWNKERVAELVKAGEVLAGERAALTKLVGRLRREQMEVEGRRNEHEDEIRNIKDRLLSGNFVQRNKLLVKGASSFNSLVRALKSDVLASANARSEPELLYAVDKLSMDQISVFPDGELHVKAIKDGKDGTALPIRRLKTRHQPRRPPPVTTAATAGSVTPTRTVSPYPLQPRERISQREPVMVTSAPQGYLDDGYFPAEKPWAAGSSRNSDVLPENIDVNMRQRSTPDSQSTGGAHVMWAYEVEDAGRSARVTSYENPIATSGVYTVSEGQYSMQEQQVEPTRGHNGIGRGSRTEDVEERGDLETTARADSRLRARGPLPPRPKRPASAGAVSGRRDSRDSWFSHEGKRPVLMSAPLPEDRGASRTHVTDVSTSASGPWQAGRAWSPANSTESL
ncbi:hypothetical protein CBR_g12224 [Chara braunii]|uniref:Sfi1 spindle body domain-containing protein n=1 Tax=Chara braunii TaxID=69332 RepID=A0A388KRF3_CHABU|nr:hypothetical protein CBR_g12224 [Chara braunii]|eukprot:GBG72650.1 hypothetical protein CBR_g12224 [Chara braunii]